MSYLYETHLHTDESSRCGRTPARKYIPYYIDMGYTGIIVTDHFTGNVSYVPNRSDPWKKQVDEYCRGYEEALDEGIKRGLDVFFGVEQCFDRDEVLIYGPDKQWLYDHPGIATASRSEVFRMVDAMGGVVVHAHPFRVRDYVTTVTLNSNVHAVEIYNAGNDADADIYAAAFADLLGLPVTSGSDMHMIGIKPAPPLYGMRSDKKWNSVMDYVSAIRGNAGLSPIAPEGRGTGIPGPLQRPYEFIDKDDRSIGWDINSLKFRR